MNSVTSTVSGRKQRIDMRRIVRAAMDSCRDTLILFCSNTVIQCDLENFTQLENCTVIEGSLAIVQISIFTKEDYANLSFPHLREITGYLLISRAFGLHSLRRLLPNLAVIRGQKLFRNTFALAVHDNPDLQDLGLVSLTNITNGAVRLSQNKKLCNIETIDWGMLAPKVPKEKHVFKDNREEKMCPNVCNRSCVVEPNSQKRRCWNSEADGCQKGPGFGRMCPSKQPCPKDEQCCHTFCAGGCTGLGPSNCIACEHVIFKRKCEPFCPPSTYLFAGRRCLTDVECLSIGRQISDSSLAMSSSSLPLSITQQLQGTSPSNRSQFFDMEMMPKLLRPRVGNGLCVFKCPEGYTLEEKPSGPECVECTDVCPK
ncbi:insulin receptor-related protein, partial [Plakobranchus ocellatus]